MPKYIALIGDIKQSKRIENRSQAQQNIQQALARVNEAHAGLIASRLTLTLGDEFQALLLPRVGIMRLMDDLEAALPMYPFRLGLGYGGISTKIDPDISIGADGECFWHAREAIQYVHDKHFGGKSGVRLLGFGGLRDDMQNALLQSSDLIKAGWTKLQADTFRHMLARGIYTDSFEQKVFAGQIGISESSLTKRLNAGNIKLYLRLRALIGRAVEEWAHADE